MRCSEAVCAVWGPEPHVGLFLVTVVPSPQQPCSPGLGHTPTHRHALFSELLPWLPPRPGPPTSPCGCPNAASARQAPGHTQTVLPH